MVFARATTSWKLTILKEVLRHNARFFRHRKTYRVLALGTTLCFHPSSSRLLRNPVNVKALVQRENEGLLERGEFIPVEAKAESRSMRRSITFNAAEVFIPGEAGGQERATVESKQTCIHAVSVSRDHLFYVGRRCCELRTQSEARKGRERLMSRCDWMSDLP